MNRIALLLLACIAVALCGSSAAFCLAALPSLSLDELTADASYVFTGKVLRIYCDEQRDSAEWTTKHYIAEVRIDRQEKGRLAGKLAYVRYYEKRFTGDGPQPAGNYGHRPAPKQDNVVRVYAIESEDGALNATQPNGWKIIPTAPSHLEVE